LVTCEIQNRNTTNTNTYVTQIQLCNRPISENFMTTKAPICTTCRHKTENKMTLLRTQKVVSGS